MAAIAPRRAARSRPRTARRSAPPSRPTPPPCSPRRASCPSRGPTLSWRGARAGARAGGGWSAAPPPRGRRPGGAGTRAMIGASGERVRALCADAPRWQAALAPRLGGFTVAPWECAGEAAAFDHVVALEPPPFGLPEAPVVLAWGPAEEV